MGQRGSISGGVLCVKGETGFLWLRHTLFHGAFFASRLGRGERETGWVRGVLRFPESSCKCRHSGCATTIQNALMQEYFQRGLGRYDRYEKGELGIDPDTSEVNSVSK